METCKKKDLIYDETAKQMIYIGIKIIYEVVCIILKSMNSIDQEQPAVWLRYHDECLHSEGCADKGRYWEHQGDLQPDS